MQLSCCIWQATSLSVGASACFSLHIASLLLYLNWHSPTWPSCNNNVALVTKAGVRCVCSCLSTWPVCIVCCTYCYLSQLKFNCNHAGGPDGQALSVQTIINSALAGPQQGPAAQATADLLLSCLQGKPSPAEEFAHTLHHILSLSEEGHGSEDDVAIITGKFHDVSRGSSAPGAALAVLLVQRLLQTVLQQPSNVLQWSSPALDAVATQLADFGSTTPSQNGSTGVGKDDLNAEAAALDPAAQEEAAEAAELAASVAAAPLDASERTDAAQETADSSISQGALQSTPSNAEATTEADSSCAELLGLMVSGKGNASLLSDQAALQVFSDLKSALAPESSVQGMTLLSYTFGSDARHFACCRYHQISSGCSQAQT